MPKLFLQAAAVIALTIVVALVLFTTIAHADVVAHISLGQQRMLVSVDGRNAYSWPVSTARAGSRTPAGTYRPYMLSPNHRSSLYGGAPMPYAIFFKGNYAIHGTTEVKQLGRPASHGCVRLHPKHAARLYTLVQQHGTGGTVIRITR